MSEREVYDFGVREYENNKSNGGFFTHLKNGTVITHTSLLRSKTVMGIAARHGVICEMPGDDSPLYEVHRTNYIVVVTNNAALAEIEKAKEPIMFNVDNLLVGE